MATIGQSCPSAPIIFEAIRNVKMNEIKAVGEPHVLSALAGSLER